MDISTCIISLGSNTDAEQNLKKAYELLVRAYPGIIFSPVQKSIPRDMKYNHTPFLNQVACFDTNQTLEEVGTALKVMERLCGRRPADKERETVCIDLDLLAHGDTICKPMDFKLYAQEIKSLLNEKGKFQE